MIRNGRTNVLSEDKNGEEIERNEEKLQRKYWEPVAPFAGQRREEAAKRLGTSQTNNESPGAISFVSQTIVDIGRGPVRFTTTRENEVEGGEARFEQA